MRKMKPLLCCLTLAAGCSPPQPPTPTCNGVAAWEPDVRPLLVSRCGGCHTDPPASTISGGAPPPMGFRLDRYEDTGMTLGARSKADRILERVKGSTMPPSPLPQLTAAEKQLIDTWVCLDAPAARDAGPQDAGSTGDAGCPDIAWVPDIEPLLVNNCGRCHTHPPKNDLIDAGTYAGLVPAATFRLDRYEDTTEPDGGMVSGAKSLVASIVERVALDSAPMPPPNLPRLTAEEQKRIADWACNGAPRVRRSACDAGAAADGGC